MARANHLQSAPVGFIVPEQEFRTFRFAVPTARGEEMMKTITVDRELVAYCGLYCGACRAYLKGRCPGCHENVKAKWCGIRTCVGQQGYATCADCAEFADPADCRKFNNLIGRVFGLVFNSDRRACVLKVRELDLDGYAAFMAERGRQSLPRRGRAVT